MIQSSVLFALYFLVGDWGRWLLGWLVGRLVGWLVGCQLRISCIPKSAQRPTATVPARSVFQMHKIQIWAQIRLFCSREISLWSLTMEPLVELSLFS